MNKNDVWIPGQLAVYPQEKEWAKWMPFWSVDQVTLTVLSCPCRQSRRGNLMPLLFINQVMARKKGVLGHSLARFRYIIINESMLYSFHSVLYSNF
jgi:hypothetical protein